MMNHSDCVKKLIRIGKELGFEASGRCKDESYHLGNPDCIWYYQGKGEDILKFIAGKGKYHRLPLVAFEVAYSEKEKALRGSLLTLQITNAAASVIVLLGLSVEKKEYLENLTKHYLFLRIRIWTEQDVLNLAPSSVSTILEKGTFTGPLISLKKS